MPKEIPFLEIETDGIRDAAVFLDVDGTLIADHAKGVSEDILKKIRTLAQDNKVYLCSNGSPEHAKNIADATGTTSVLCRKPATGDMRALAEQAKRSVVIGDKFVTDGLLARGLRADFIKTPHVRGADDSLATKIVYFGDDIVWNIQAPILLLRPWQWIKNVLVFAPPFFAGEITDAEQLLRVTWAFAAFCLTASVTYILNDLFDRDADRLHPTKRFRPIASGEVSVWQAGVLAGVLTILDLFLVLALPQIGWPLALYVALNLLYSKWIKRVAVADVACVSLFYLLRIIVGGLAAPAALSPWIILCTLFGSLFVIIGKRRAELEREAQRAVLAQYSKQTLDMMLVSSVTLSVISYGIWSVIGHPSSLLVYTTLFVLFAVFRTLNRMYAKPEQAEAPETLVFRDPWIVGSFLLWALSVFVIFYTHF
jgi:4-hydroxybenzoate polyprenyltransferase/predicted HAD superfamily phosphohydrolase YqeG